MKGIYGIKKCEYLRGVNALREFDLHRSLPATQDGKVKLFYRPDVERALVAYMAAKPLHRPSIPSPSSQPAQAASSPFFPSSASSDSYNAISRQLAHPDLPATARSTTTPTAPALSSPASASFERDMRAAIASLAAQHQAHTKEVATLNHQLAQLAADSSSQTAASTNNELMACLVELVATIASNNASNQQLIALIE